MAVLEDILLFFDPMPGALPIYERLFERAQAELGPFSVRVQKTQITWANRHVFACASFMKVRKAKDRPKTYLVVTFGLEHTSPEEIDEELIAWLREAYAFAAAK